MDLVIFIRIAQNTSLMHGLDNLLARHSQVAVLRVLHQADQPLSGREVERRAGLSNRATMLALEALRAVYAVLREEAGGGLSVQLEQK